MCAVHVYVEIKSLNRKKSDNSVNVDCIYRIEAQGKTFEKIHAQQRSIWVETETIRTRIIFYYLQIPFEG